MEALYIEIIDWSQEDLVGAADAPLASVVIMTREMKNRADGRLECWMNPNNKQWSSC